MDSQEEDEKLLSMLLEQNISDTKFSSAGAASLGVRKRVRLGRKTISDYYTDCCLW